MRLIPVHHTRVCYFGFGYTVMVFVRNSEFTTLWYVTSYIFRYKFTNVSEVCVDHHQVLCPEDGGYKLFQKFGLFIHSTLYLIPRHYGYYRQRRSNLDSYMLLCLILVIFACCGDGSFDKICFVIDSLDFQI